MSKTRLAGNQTRSQDISDGTIQQFMTQMMEGQAHGPTSMQHGPTNVAQLQQIAEGQAQVTQVMKMILSERPCDQNSITPSRNTTHSRSWYTGIFWK